jgi:hypothetical protein
MKTGDAKRRAFTDDLLCDIGIAKVHITKAAAKIRLSSAAQQWSVVSSKLEEIHIAIVGLEDSLQTD